MPNKYGFELIKTREIPELKTKAELYRHIETGAELLSLQNDDENKVFGITFRTPRHDDTGLPHIMEHTVLCGSRKYPLKDPFIELVKSSLKTYINAMTYPDKTSYPVASQNLQDFYNLIDVYLDAVFYPRITEDFFRQEGWHYELDAPDAALTYGGIVFNEMKGNYASPDYLSYESTVKALFPGHLYSFDAGGDPAAIPSLSYADFKAFHETYYHPSNARIYFYGDAPLETQLSTLQNYLKDFEAREVHSKIDLAPAFDAPRQISAPYPASDDEEQQKALVTVGWVLPENTNPTLTYALQMLSHMLTGIAASPLRKALIDSGLGEDTIGDGLDDELRQLYYTTGLRGVAMENTAKIEPLILETLAEIVAQGIDGDTVEAALNTIEFHLREQNFGSQPRGMGHMFQALTTWLHDGDPLEVLGFEAALAEIKAQLAADPTYFESLLQTHLLDNPHRVCVILEPDADLQKRRDDDEKARLAETRAKMDQAALHAVQEAAQKLKTMQATPETPEALAAIPTLKLEDLDKTFKKVPSTHTHEQNTPILHHDLYTNAIMYLDLGFDLHTLPQELLPYAALFGDALLEIGTASEDFVKLTQHIGRKTGGIRRSTISLPIRNSNKAAAWLMLRAKATMPQTEELFTILQDVLLNVKLDNQERFTQMVLEKKAQLEAMIVPSGHRMVLSRLQAKFNAAYWAKEQMSGISYLFFLRQLAEEIAQDWPAVLAKLETVRQSLINRNAMLCNVTLDGKNWQKVQPQLSAFLDTLSAKAVTQVTWTPIYDREPEGLVIPSQVNFVAKGANLRDLGYTPHGSSVVIGNYLRSTWLWERVRLQGGAYGGFCVFDPHSGLFGYASYRDPHLLQTLENYDKASNFLRTLDLQEAERVKSIIGGISIADAYQLADAKGYSALNRHLINYSDAERQQYRDELLSTSPDNFKELGGVLERLNEQGLVVVLGSQEAIEKAQSESGIPFKITKVL